MLKSNTSAYKVEFAEVDQNKASSSVQTVDIAALLALGTVEHGQKVFKNAVRATQSKKGGRNNIGPALYNVLGEIWELWKITNIQKL